MNAVQLDPVGPRLTPKEITQTMALVYCVMSVQPAKTDLYS